MRHLIDLIAESEKLPSKKPITEAPELLEEGVRDQIEAIVDRVLGLFSPNHVTYAAACGAIDHVNELTGGKTYFSYTKDELMIGGKLAKETAATVVGVSLALSKVAALGLPITAAIVAAATSIVAASIARIGMSKRSMVKMQADRAIERSPAPVKKERSVEDEFNELLGNIDRLTTK